MVELRNITARYEEQGFPGCVGCLDCMHLKWKNCPKALKGQNHNPKDGKLATLSCEALVGHDLYCWHWFPGRCGTNNDITVVDNSPLIIDIISGRRTMTLPEGYNINGVFRHWLLYVLGDGIYPDWAIFVKPNSAPLTDQQQHITKRQEAVRKDVERFFGCLQGRFKILRYERHEWSDEEIILISQVCVILHNMITKMSLQGELDEEFGQDLSIEEDAGIVRVFFQDNIETETQNDVVHSGGLTHLLERDALVTSLEAHLRLTEAINEHLWAIRGRSLN